MGPGGDEDESEEEEDSAELRLVPADDSQGVLDIHSWVTTWLQAWYVEHVVLQMLDVMAGCLGVARQQGSGLWLEEAKYSRSDTRRPPTLCFMRFTICTDRHLQGFLYSGTSHVL
jgi:hypothetical protein